jgi:hypothetical protein
MRLHKGLLRSWSRIQQSPFPWLKEELDTLTEKQKKLFMVLEVIQIKSHLT